MNRRDALRLLAANAIIPLAPHALLALRNARAVVTTPRGLGTLNAHQEATVTALAEMILPRTDTPGAADVGATQFIDLLLTEWYDEPDRSRFLKGLEDVDARSQALFARDFVGCSTLQQSEILIWLGEQMTEEDDRRKDQPSRENDSEVEPRENFYPMLRRLTLTAYYTSEAGATQELHFEVIPDRHDSCAEIESGKGGPSRQ